MCECILTHCTKIVRAAVEEACKTDVGGIYEEILVAFPTEKGRGHLYTNAAMKMAKPMKMSPMDAGELICSFLEKDDIFARVQLLKPGFINMDLRPQFIHRQMIQLLKQKDKFGHQNIGCGERVNVEYVSANPTGPLHVANARGAILGDVLASVLSALGYDVCREYYINDGGGQVEVLSKSLFQAYKKALGLDYKMEKNMYTYQYLFDLGQELAKQDLDKWIHNPQEDSLHAVGEFGVERILSRIKEDLGKLGVCHDVFSSEKAICSQGGIEEAVSLLQEKGYVYEGYLPPPKGKGANPENYRPRKQLLFRASEFGDSQDRPMQKENGDWTYFAVDVAYHLDKIKRGFLNQIVLLGADHGSYLRRMEGAVSAVSDRKATLRCFVYQLVNLIKEGDKVSMSKRSGNFVPLQELLNEVEGGTIRFTMLTRHHNVQLDFDCEKVVKETRENPYYYLQYAYVRAFSVLNKGNGIDVTENATEQDLATLDNHAYLSLMVKILAWPSCIRQAAISLDPHKIASYMLELAALFHEVWSLGNRDSSLRFIQQTQDPGKMALVQATAFTFESGMGILGIEPLQEL